MHSLKKYLERKLDKEGSLFYLILNYVHRIIYVFINNSFVIPYRAKKFENNAIIVIKNIQNDLTELKVDFFFFFGTLLGIVRDGEFIVRDSDLDLLVHVEDEKTINHISQLLIQKGYKHKYRSYANGIGIIQDTFYLNGVRMDINYLFKKENLDCVYMSYKIGHVILLEFPSIKTIIKYSFKGIDVNIPGNFADILECLYGKNWRVPDPSFKFGGYSCRKVLNITGSHEKY